MPSSTRSTRSPSPTRTATGSATCPVRWRTSTTSRGSASTRSGSTRASPHRSSTPATTSPTTCGSPRATAPTTTWSPSSTRARHAGSGSCSTSWPATPRSSTAWFQDELHAAGPSPDGDRYIWSDRPGDAEHLAGRPGGDPVGRVARATPRLLPEELLRRPAGAELRLRRAARRRALAGAGRRPRTAPEPAGAARHHGVLAGPGGGRLPVDMAFSLVKDDPGFVQTTLLWRELRGLARRHLSGGGHHPGGHRAARCRRAGLPCRLLPRHRPAALLALRQRRGGDVAGSAADAARRSSTPRARGRPTSFLAAWEAARADWPDRPILLASADHDFSRLACGARTATELGAAFTFLLTWGSVPVASTTATRSACATAPTCPTSRGA